MSLPFVLEIFLQILFFWFITYGINPILRFGFSKVHQKTMDDSNQLGRHIGAAERALMFVGMVANHWELVTTVLALKALARFKEMDRKHFAEYFLMGSLWSLLVCVVSAWGYVRWVGWMRLDRWSW